MTIVGCWISLVALTLTLACAIVLEVPPGNGAKKHLRLLAWQAVIAWVGIVLETVVNLHGHVATTCGVIFVGAALVNCVLSISFLIPVLGAFRRRR